MKKWILPLVGAFAGGALGFAYWNFIGCMSGSCPITSSPVNSTIYGVVMGSLLANIFSKSKDISV